MPDIRVQQNLATDTLPNQLKLLYVLENIRLSTYLLFNIYLFILFIFFILFCCILLSSAETVIAKQLKWCALFLSSI